MAYQFNPTQIAHLQALVSEKKYWQAYEYIYTETSDLLNGQYTPKAGVEPAAWVWFWGAAAVNKGEGPASDFIRQYTNQQHIIRYGSALSTTQLNEASNAIAEAVLSDIIRSESLLNLITISDTDASISAASYFEGNTSVWSGNVLFLGLGHSSPFNNTILESAQGGNTYNLLSAIKSTLYAGMQISNWTVSIPNYWAGVLPAGSAFVLNGLSGPISSAISASQTALTDAYGGASALLQSIIGETVGTALGLKLVLGTEQNDTQLSGSASNELMHGGDGDDRLLGSDGNDIMDGGAGRDVADFSATTQSLTVTVKNVASTAGFTAQVSGSGLDSLFGIEKIVGSSADDTFAIQSAPSHLADLTLDGGAGEDQLTAVYLDRVTIDTNKKIFNFGDKNVSFDNFEKYQGSNGNDTFILRGNEKEIDGKAGEDTVDYRELDQGLKRGNSTTTYKDIEIIHGSHYGDEFTAPNNEIEIYGEGGNDTIFFKNENAKLHFDGGSGTDIGSFQERESAIAMTLSEDGPSIGERTFNSVEVFIGTQYNDTFELDGSLGAVIQGGAGVDQFIFSPDSAFGGDRPLVIWGGPGADEYRFSNIESGYSPKILHVNIAGLVDGDVIDYEKIIELTKNSIPQYVLDEFENGTIEWNRPDIIIINGGEDKIYLDERLVAGAEYQSVTDSGERTFNDLVYAGPTIAANGGFEIIYGQREVDGQGYQELLYHHYEYETTLGSVSDGFIDYDGERISDGDKSINKFAAGNLNLFGYSNGEFGISTTTGWSAVFYEKGVDYIEEYIFSGLKIEREIIWEYERTYRPGYVIEQAFYLSGGGFALNRNDVLFEIGGAEDPLNRVDGGDGDDTLSGSSGDDLIKGGGGDDILLGSAGHDTLDGGAGNDWVSYAGATGPVSVILSDPNYSSGLANQDTYIDIEGFRLTDYNDVFIGSANAEIVEGGAGNDYMFGGGGRDTFVIDQDDGNDTISGFKAGANGDIIRFSPGIFTNFAALIAFAEQAGSHTVIYYDDNNSITLIDVDLGQLMAENFEIPQSEINNVVALPEGGYLEGTNGNDSFTGNVGSDTFYGGKGNDLFDGGGNEYDQVDLDGSETDWSFNQNTDGSVTAVRVGWGTLQLKNIDGIYFYASQQWHALPSLVPNYVNTIHAAETGGYVQGTDGNDRFIGAGGNDTFYAAKGNDVALGGTGQDQLDLDGLVSDWTFARNTDGSVTAERAGWGSVHATSFEAVYFYGDGHWSSMDALAPPVGLVVNGTTGDDTLEGAGGDDEINGLAGNDDLFGKEGDDVLNGGTGHDLLVGGDGNDLLNGDDSDLDAGNDTLAAGGGNDTLNGFAGNDVLYGEAGNDIINGGAGDDQLYGLEDDDTLTGGAGNDVFVFGMGFGKDTITDFVAGSGTDDVIEFDDAVFADLSSVLAAASQVGADTLISYDVNNTITLKNVTMANLHQDDFRFV